MFKLVKDVELLKNEVYNEYEFTYYFYYDDQIIGTGALRKDDTNMMLFYIKPNYRGNGYGTILFDNLVETLFPMIMLLILVIVMVELYIQLGVIVRLVLVISMVILLGLVVHCIFYG